MELTPFVYPHLPFASPVETFLSQQNYYTTINLICQVFSVILVPNVWIEQTTYRLQGGCSTTELIGPTITYLGGG